MFLQQEFPENPDYTIIEKRGIWVLSINLD
jgi:hypothetical protein